MDMTEKTIASKEIFDGRVLHMFHDTVALSDGTTSLREIVRHPGGVCIAALDGENNLLFVSCPQASSKRAARRLKTESASCSRKRER